MHLIMNKQFETRNDFERKSQKYRNRYMDAINELYRDTEAANNEIGNASVKRSRLNPSLDKGSKKIA